MFVLLSSDYSPRYKEDVLRCLAAPKGTTVQFRYDRVHVADSILGALKKGDFKYPSEGIVCSVAGTGDPGALLMVPVRAVEINQVPNEHGTTISIVLTMKEVLVADPKTFTTQVFTLSGQTSPQIPAAGQGPNGKYFFEVSGELGSLKRGTTLKEWEESVVSLREQLAFKEEPFFWTVLGIGRKGTKVDTNTFRDWPDTVGSSESLELLVYHYQPKGGSKPNSKLEVIVGDLLKNDGPPAVKVDSRYDLKRWTLQTQPKGHQSQDTWIRVRAADAWDLDVTLRIKGTTIWPTVGKGVLAGVLIATPSVLAIVPQTLEAPVRCVLIGVSILAGVAAGLLAVFHGERFD